MSEILNVDGEIVVQQELTDTQVATMMVQYEETVLGVLVVRDNAGHVWVWKAE